MDFTEKTISSECVYDGKVIKLYVDRAVLPNGKEATREVSRHAGAVAVLPITDDGRAILVRQLLYCYTLEE